MAVVKITDTFIQQLKNSIDNRYEQRFAEVVKKIRGCDQFFSWKMYWPQHLVPHAQALVGHLSQCETTNLDIKYDKKSFSLELKLSEPGPIPTGTTHSYYNRFVINDTKPAFATYYAAVLPHIIEYHALESEREEFKNGVINAIQQFSTVNQALKSWPALENLLPPAVLSKVREKIVRAKPEVASVDQQTLNTQLLKLQILS